MDNEVSFDSIESIRTKLKERKTSLEGNKTEIFKLLNHDNTYDSEKLKFKALVVPLAKKPINIAERIRIEEKLYSQDNLI